MVRQALTIAAMALACLGLVGCGDQYGAYQPDPTPMAAVVATAVATATSDIQAPASDAVQFCAFDGYDAGAVRCLRPDASYDHSTDPGATERAVWPASAATIDIRQKDGTGAWVVVSGPFEDPTVPGSTISPDGLRASAPIEALFSPICGAYQLVAIGPAGAMVGQAELDVRC